MQATITVDTLSGHSVVGVDAESLAQAPCDSFTNTEQRRDRAPFLDNFEPGRGQLTARHSNSTPDNSARCSALG
jgi:hypothetical protein